MDACVLGEEDKRVMETIAGLLLYCAPFYVVYIIYESLRAIVPLIVSGRIDAITPLRFEEALFGAPLFLILYHYRNILLDAFFSMIYALHPLYALVYAVYLYLSRRIREYIWYASAFMATSLLGLIIFVIWPVAPPWMSPVTGVSRIPNYFTRLLSSLGLSSEGVDPNPYAAMPSLHVGLSIVFAASIYRVIRSRRWVAIIWPVLMGVTVVYTGNHYLLDVFAAVPVALAGMHVGPRLFNAVFERIDSILGRIAGHDLEGLQHDGIRRGSEPWTLVQAGLSEVSQTPSSLIFSNTLISSILA